MPIPGCEPGRGRLGLVRPAITASFTAPLPAGRDGGWLPGVRTGVGGIRTAPAVSAGSRTTGREDRAPAGLLDARSGPKGWRPRPWSAKPQGCGRSAANEDVRSIAIPADHPRDVHELRVRPGDPACCARGEEQRLARVDDRLATPQRPPSPDRCRRRLLLREPAWWPDAARTAAASSRGRPTEEGRPTRRPIASSPRTRRRGRASSRV